MEYKLWYSMQEQITAEKTNICNEQQFEVQHLTKIVSLTLNL